MVELVASLGDGPLQGSGKHTQLVLGEERREPVEHIIDRAILVLIDLVGAALGNAIGGKLGGDGVDRGIDRRRAHGASSRMVIAPDLLRLASMPWPNALATSSSTRLLIEVTAEHAPLQHRGSRASRTLLKPRRCCPRG